MTKSILRGFTLLEVLMAVAILGLGLTVLLGAQVGMFTNAKRAERLSLATNVARCRMSELKVQGGPGYDHLLCSFVPRLIEGGFDVAAIHRMLVENPARILAIDAG